MKAYKAGIKVLFKSVYITENELDKNYVKELIADKLSEVLTELEFNSYSNETIKFEKDLEIVEVGEVEEKEI